MRAKILCPSMCVPFVSQSSAPWRPPMEMPFLTEFLFRFLEEAITTNEVINQLLHHVGAMCIHQLNLLATNPNLPITSVLGKQHPIEAHHLSSICDIMEKAMVNGDTCIIRCILVVFQVNAPFRHKILEKKKHKTCFQPADCHQERNLITFPSCIITTL